MPMHDWTKVDAGIYHAFHHEWISEIQRALNRGILPADHYALPEQFAAGFGPDVFTLQHSGSGSENAGGVALQSRPTTRFTAEASTDFCHRKQKVIAVRHVSGDEVVAIIEIVSPGNKAGRKAFQDFLDKAYSLLQQRIDLLIIDPFPPGPRDPNGVHAAIWEEIQGEPFELPEDKNLTMVSYECALNTLAYIEPVAIGDRLPEMPLFLKTNGCVMVPLDATYNAAFGAMPRRWRDVLE